MNENPVQSTAVHEGGHAVAALHFGIPFECVEVHIDAVDGFWHCGGRLRGTELPEIASSERLWKQLIVVMSGYAAQTLFAQTTNFSLGQFKSPDARDFEAATDVLMCLQPPVLDLRNQAAAMERAFHESQLLIHANWPRLAAIANELVRLSQQNGATVACRIALTPTQLLQLRLPST